ITPTAGAGGSIMPGTPQTVNHGGSQAFSIAASSGYHIVDVGVDGVSQGVLASYTFENVMANHTITAAFALEAGPTAPAVPTLLAPPNGIVTTTQSLTLSWQPASTGGMPDGYNVLLDGVTITTTNTTLPTVLAAGIHTWTVRAFNGGGYSAWTASWTVTVEAYRIYLPLVLRNTP
ncbi:MAG: hypothetical protein JW934_07045, partial [Anaerolineae bacterium]|nr:hypothetical protein [Anaerolineae bacterium]